MSDATADEVLRVNARLLDSIVQADWAAYQELCDPTLTAFEPEALGQCVHGLEFHHFYFQRRPAPGSVNVTVVAPHVRVMGDTAVVTYVRLTQRQADGGATTAGHQETRVWQRRDGKWLHVHFHRSPMPGA